ncbi:MAG: polysulfide reductase NrfD [Saprospiraceae bacterium]|nr:polysulfide reductase NrfD [Saprospiraceae bacterium]
MIPLSDKSKRILDKVIPDLEKISTLWKVWVAFLVACILFGLYGLYVQIVDGHSSTGMRDHVIWGLFVVNFIFFLGISYAGALIASIFHLFKVRWRRPFIRIATIMAISGGIVGPIFILLCMGRMDRLHYLFIYPRLQSPIIWDVFAITTYLVGAILFLYLGIIKDFAVFRDYKLANFKNWQNKLYKVLGINYQATKSQDIILAKARNILALVLVPLVIIVSSILSWIFGMTLRPGWHSTIFGPYFVLASIYSGIAVIIIAMWIFRNLYNLQQFFTDRHFVLMGLALVIVGAGYGYFTFSEYLTSWYVSEEWDSRVMEKLLNFDEYGAWFFWSNILGILLPFIVIAFRKLRKPIIITWTSALVLLSLWIKRYLIIVPTLETPLLPLQDFRPEFVHYSATWVEWSLTLAGIASFLLMFSLITRFVPIIPVTELIGEEEEADNKKILNLI